MTDEDCILIAGAGPVGIITGLCLARAGIPVKLFDALSEVPEDHRAATLQPSTLDLAQDIGLTAKVMPRGIESPVFQFRDRVTDEVVAEFDFGLLKDETPYPFALQIEQHKTIHAALELAQAYPEFELQRPYEVTGVEQCADHVEITVSAPDGSEARHRGRYLVGCDGPGGVVRSALGIELDGPGVIAHSVNIFFRTPDLVSLHDKGWAKFYRLIDETGCWAELIAIDGIELWRLTVFHEFSSGPDAQAYLRKAVGRDFPFEIIDASPWERRDYVARHYGEGRVFIAGDAAPEFAFLERTWLDRRCTLVGPIRSVDAARPVQPQSGLADS